MRRVYDRISGLTKDKTKGRCNFADCAFRAAMLSCFTLLVLAAMGFQDYDATADQKNRPPVAVTFENPYGAVVFNHEAHKSHNCSECHPPFDFKLDPGSGYSLRAHGLCKSCHEKSAVSTQCNTCHNIHARTKKPLDPAVMKSEAGDRQKILDLFFKRRSIRKFQDRKVPDQMIRDLLKAAMAAPSAGNWQPWEFVVVKSDGIKVALSGISPFAKFVKDAPVVICIAGRRDNHWAPFDCALAAGNLLLAAAGFDLGATYCGLDDEREGRGREILGIPDGYYLYSLVPVGYPAESKSPHTKYNPDRIHWERFEAGRPETVVGE